MQSLGSRLSLTYIALKVRIQTLRTLHTLHTQSPEYKQLLTRYK